MKANKTNDKQTLKERQEDKKVIESMGLNYRQILKLRLEWSKETKDFNSFNSLNEILNEEVNDETILFKLKISA